MGTACFAPASSLYLRPDGFVLPCCASGRPLGRVTGPRRQSLHEIWKGAAAQQTRDALARRDFRLGCDECAALIDQGREDETVARAFDRFADTGPTPGFPRYIDFALSNRCNLECVMCNGDLSSSIRANREHRPPLADAYDDRFFDELRAFLPHLERAHFKGGEPFLSPAVKRVWDDLAALAPNCDVSVVTNATHLSDAALQRVADLRMRVSVSIDAVDPELFESIRRNASYQRVSDNIDRLQAVAPIGRPVELVFCIMPENVHEVGRFLHETERRGTDASLIWVNSPARFDLLAQPRSVVAAALDRLECDERAWDGPLGPTRPLWDSTLTRLRTHLDAYEETSVRITAGSHSSPAPPPADIASLIEEARARSGVEPVVVRSVQGIWASADAPSWAEALDCRNWIGTSVADTLSLIWSATGASPTYEVTKREDGVQDIALRLDEGSGLPDLRVFVTPEHPRLGTVLVLAPQQASVVSA